MLPQDEPLPNIEPSDDPDATAWRPSSDPEATRRHVSSFGPGSATDGFTVGFVLSGKFRLEKLLGRGGMGEAWKAFDTLAERAVVLKFVPKEIQHVKEAMDSVKDSFKKVHALQHQHICPVYDLFQDELHGLCLVMKFIDGMPLDEYRRHLTAKNKGLSFNDLVQILWGVALGLDYAHEKKVVHRDIKPQNIMVGKTDGVQIIDFGLAEEIRTSMVRFSDVTMDIAGTRPYMAPEQWQGKYQDAATDQYALAVTAYELFSGRVPFQGSDVGILRECVLHDAPDPIPSLPDYINAAMLKALSKQREDRFESCKEFVRALTTKPKKKSVPHNADADADATPADDAVSLPSIDLKSENQDETVWKPPRISTDMKSRPTSKPVRRKSAPLYASIAVAAAVVILGLFFAFSEKGGNTSKEPKKPAATAPKPVKNVAKKESPVKRNTPPPDPVPEFLTPEQYHQLEIETVQWLRNECNGGAFMMIDGNLEFFEAKKLPERFGNLTNVSLWAPDRQPEFTVPGQVRTPCAIPGYIHWVDRCSCQLTLEQWRRIGRLNRLDHLHLGGLLQTTDDWERIFPSMRLHILDICIIPKLPHWNPLKHLSELHTLLAYDNDLEKVHFEAMAALPSLSFLNVNNGRITPGSLEPLRENDTIEQLRIASLSSLTEMDFRVLGTMKKLKKLDCSSTVLSRPSLAAIAEISALRELILSNNGIIAAELTEFRRKRPDVSIDLKGQTVFPVAATEVVDTEFEKPLGELLWSSVSLPFSAPGPLVLETNQGPRDNSLFAPAPSSLKYDLGRRWKTLQSKIGIIKPQKSHWGGDNYYVHMPGAGNVPSVVFVVKGDGRELYRSNLITDSNEQEISVDISGIDTLELIVEDGGDGPRFDAAAWFDPKLKRDAAPKTEVGQNMSLLSDEKKKSLQ